MLLAAEEVLLDSDDTGEGGDTLLFSAVPSLEDFEDVDDVLEGSLLNHELAQDMGHTTTQLEKDHDSKG